MNSQQSRRMSYRGFHCLLVGCLVLTTGTCQNSIVSTTTLTPGNIFSVYCDDSYMLQKTKEFKTRTGESLQKVSDLTIYRTTAVGTGGVLIANYKAKPASGIAKLSTNIPKGRIWGFSSYGDNNGTNNKDTMKLSWTVYDTECEDAGNYTCQVQYYINSGRSVFSFSVMDYVVTVDACFNPIVWPKPIERNKTIHVNCDRSRFHIPENDIFSVATVTVNRDYGLNKGFLTAVQYESGVSPNSPEGTTSRPAAHIYVHNEERMSNLNFNGANSAVGANKKPGIEWSTINPQNVDVGTFNCEIEYFRKDYKRIKLSRNESVYFNMSPPKRKDLLPVLSVDRSNVPGYFNITCDAKRVSFPVEHLKVTGILESRITVAFDKKPPSREGSDESLNEKASTDICHIIRSGRKWEVIKGDYRDNYANVVTASTKVIVHDPSCDDAGTYRCDIVYRDPLTTVHFHKVTEKQRLENPCDKIVT